MACHLPGNLQHHVAAGLGLLALLLPSNHLFADEANGSGFVEANILAVFYHELGHAVIDVEAVPIFGQEEDAADNFSIFLIDALFQDEVAQAFAYDASFGFLVEAELRAELGEDAVWWGVHGPDEQRFYNTVCLFYGASPETREQFALDMELPPERAETCAEEYDQANQSWGAVLDELSQRGGGTSLSFASDEPGFATEIIRSEVEYLNSEFTLAAPIAVTVEDCGEPNAFYDPSHRLIVFCTEFEDHLHDLEQRLFSES